MSPSDFSIVTNSNSLILQVDSGGGCAYARQRVYGSSVFPLSFAVNLKLLLKKKQSLYILK